MCASPAGGRRLAEGVARDEGATKMKGRAPIDGLVTEGDLAEAARLDCMSTREVLELIAREDAKVAVAVARALPEIERAVELVRARLAAGGRLFFVGCGTSGRLGAMEAAECPPTFGTPSSMVRAVVAGGRRALWRSVEGAEDEREGAWPELERAALSAVDAVVGIAASAGTPFVEGALDYARGVGAATVLVACNSVGGSPRADVDICVDVGPEVIAGSTRMKSGTATKMVLNMLTTAAMVGLGKTYGNLMVEVRPASEKLKMRQERIVMKLVGVDRKEARRLLEMAGRDVKTAVVVGRLGVTVREAKRRLVEARGRLRAALGEGVPGGGKRVQR